ncbi:hypothetical protein H4R99_003507 [Coemansia sp. RSA 1722]|nr:hypothetical protein LPJ57_001574 [Coemansia sp. RSA 486]KAJ2599962.1 hypothetical protein H4R99_003507 [Coemansia sp. RSA 1722]
MEEQKKHRQPTTGTDKQEPPSAKKPRRRNTKPSTAAGSGAVSADGQQVGIKSNKPKASSADNADNDRKVDPAQPLSVARGKGKGKQSESTGASPPTSLAKRTPRGRSEAAAVASAAGSKAKAPGVSSKPQESEKTSGGRDQKAGARKKNEKPKSSPRPGQANPAVSSPSGAATPNTPKRGPRSGRTSLGGSRAPSPTGQQRPKQPVAAQTRESPQKASRGERRRETVQKTQQQQQKQKKEERSAGQQAVASHKDDPVAKQKQPVGRASRAKPVKEKAPQQQKQKQQQQQAGGSKAGVDSEASRLPMVSDRLSTKVCIRWLPSDLPEHVFWRSVEPALPWYNPEMPGAMVCRQREVLCLQDETDSHGMDQGQDQQVPKSEPETNELGPEPEPEPSASSPDSEVPVQPEVRLARAPTRTVDVDVFSGPAIDKLDEHPYWRCFVSGKTHRTRAKPADPARAYILFSTQAEVDYFYRRYHGHTFAKNGAVRRAVVELASFQHVALDESPDRIEGTIDDDADFQAFLNPHLVQHKPKPSAARVSYAAAAASKPALSAEHRLAGTEAGGAPSSTPLIDYLRAIKSKSLGRAGKPAAVLKNGLLAKGTAGGRSAAAAAAGSSGGGAINAASASASAAAAASASATSKAQEDSGSKRRRRRNR